MLAGNLLVNYLDEEKSIVGTPADLNFSAEANRFMLYQPTFGSLLFPPASEPGDYRLYYPYLFGGNNTVIANLAGGGASSWSTVDGSFVDTTVSVGSGSGGAQSVWVRDGNGTTGRILYSSPLLVNMGPPAPPGFEGVQSFTWSPDRNGTFTIGIVNSFGLSTPVGYYEATVHSAKGPNLDYTFLWVFLAGCAGFIALGRFLLRDGRSGTDVRPIR